jgi:hypothetical protein
MRKVLFVCLGAVVGSFVGWVLSIVWMACAGDLMMPANVYEVRRRSIAFAMWTIIGLGALIGGAVVASVLYKEPSNRF